MSDILPNGPQDLMPCHTASESTNQTIGPEKDQNETVPGLRPWLICLSVLPFLAIPVAHLLSDTGTATGLFHYELPYYVANGRAALERGNGVFYPNPFDPSADAPAIYVHWLPEMLGIATSEIGADPGELIVWLTFAMALVFAAVTQRLAAACLPVESANSCVAFLAIMWGGGVLVTGNAVTSLLVGDLNIDLLALDPGNGMWFLNWGRNALFPTEALYHSLTACCWITEIRRRRAAANIFLLLLATTHPWSGLELLLTINLWRTIDILRTRQRTAVIQLCVSLTVLTAFLVYYRILLPSFEQHAALQRVWELDWSLQWSSALPAWGLVALATVYRLWTNPSAIRTTTVQFLLCVLLVSVGLSLHDRLMKPVQPLHFTRGYVWMPLCLLGIPALTAVVRRWWTRSVWSRIAVCSLGLIFVSDNLVFGTIQSWRQYQREDGFHLNVHDRALLIELHEKHAEAVVLTESETLNYLLPTYANLRPWLGHKFNTPEYPMRRAVMQRCFAGASVSVSDIPSDVTLLCVRPTRDCHPLTESALWLDCGARNGEWSIWLKVGAK